MTIKEIRQLGHAAIADRALERQKEQGNEPNENIDIWENRDYGGFTWEDTIEGGFFWLDVHDGEFDRAYSLRPHLKPKP